MIMIKHCHNYREDLTPGYLTVSLPPVILAPCHPASIDSANPPCQNLTNLTPGPGALQVWLTTRNSSSCEATMLSRYVKDFPTRLPPLLSSRSTL